MKKFLLTFMNGLFVLALGAVALLFLATLVPLPQSFDIKIVKSGSMEPYIKTGGIVVVRPASTYQVNDVITFSTTDADIPTTHRIIGFEVLEGEQLMVTKGDANEERDNALVAQQDVQGKVLVTVPYVGYLLDFARTPIGFALLIVLPALLIIIDEVDKIWKEMRRIRKGGDAPLESRDEATPPPRATRVMSERTLVVAPRVRKCVDIRKPQPKQMSGAVYPTHTPLPTRAPHGRRDAVVAVVAALLLNTLILSSAFVGSTISYFNDTESLTANLLRASAVDFLVAPKSTSYAFVGGVLESEDGAVVHVVTPEVGSASLRYSLAVENATGTIPFCNAIVGEVDTPFVYGPAPLLSLTATNIAFGAPWELLLTLAPEATPVVGESCSLELVYRAHRADANGIGYTDVERVPLTLTVQEALQGIAARSAEPGFVEILISTEGQEEEEGTEVPEETPDAPPEEMPEEGTETPADDTTPIEEEKVEEPSSEPEPEVEEVEEVEEEAPAPDTAPDTGGETPAP